VLGNMSVSATDADLLVRLEQLFKDFVKVCVIHVNLQGTVTWSVILGTILKRRSVLQQVSLHME
jgi:hypothetical protein